MSFETWLFRLCVLIFASVFKKVTGITGDTRTWTAEGRKQVQEEKAKAKVVYKERQNAERITKNFIKTLTSCFNKDKFDPKVGDTGNNI